MMNTWVANVADELIDVRLQNGDTVCFTIPTWSMYPLLAPGDQVIVRRARGDELCTGDVVIIKPTASAAWLAHRLVARRVGEGDVRLVTKGDNCVTPDPLWTESELCGIVIAVWRQGAHAPTDWRTRRARWLGVWLAHISRLQAYVFSLPTSRVQRVALKASRWLMRGSALIMHWVVR